MRVYVRNLGGTPIIIDTAAGVGADLLAAFGAGATMLNGTLTASVAANALTIALKTLAGTDPSADDPVFVSFRNATLTDSTFTVLTITAPTSLVISSGSTMGAANATPFRLWIVGFNDGGTFRLGAIKCTSSSAIYPLSEYALKSSAAEGGAGGADSAGVIYTGTAVSSKAFRVLGFMTWESGLTTAGTWNAAPTQIQLFGPGIPKPGDSVGNDVQTSTQSTVANATTAYVDTNLTGTITPSSAANLVLTVWSGETQVDTANIGAKTTLRRGGTIVGLPREIHCGAANIISSNGLSWMDAPGSSGSIVYTVATILDTGGGPTVYFPNGAGGGALQLIEIMG